MNTRRHFLKSSTAVAAMGLWSQQLEQLSSSLLSDGNNVDWEAVRALFPITEWGKIHFNSGSAGVMPLMVEEHLFKLSQLMNRMAPYEAWAIWQEELKSIKDRLGRLINCNSNDLTLIRSTTEGLNMISSGLDLTSDDEIIVASFDYPYANHTWKNKSRRTQATIVKPEIELPAEEDAIIDTYKKCITDKTRVMHITHMTHREGHIMPAKALVALAKEYNIISVVDGAHVVGQIPLDITSIQPDCYVSSLHKWLNAPHGNGLLYVQPDVLKSFHLYPSAPIGDEGDLSQFAHLGTRAFHIEIGIGAALDFHDQIGARTKYDRLQFLKHYWTDQLLDYPKIKWYTNLSDDKSCGVVTIGIESKSSGVIVKTLNEKYSIHAKPVGVKGGGVRISPNIFTSTEELDLLVAAVKEICDS